MPKRPNVVLIYTDQQRFDSIHANGNKYAITPNLDSLIEEGVNFTNYYVNNPVCMPSRMCMLTGKYPSQLKIADNGIPLPEDEKNIANYLHQYDYRCAQIGKLHFLPHTNRKHTDPHPSYGFDSLIISDEPGCYDDAYIKWVESQSPEEIEKVRVGLPSEGKVYGQPVYSTHARSPHQPYIFEGKDNLTHSCFVKEEVCQFIKNHKNSSQPFFVIAGFYAPHAPINPPKKYIDMYDLNEMPLPKRSDEDDKLMQTLLGENWFKKLEGIDDQKWKEIYASYLALTTHVDDCVGDILKELKDIEDDTLIIFTSDHGEYLGDHGRIHKGMPGHDCIINVPLIMKYKGKIKPHTCVDNLCEAVDIVPTILDYACIQKPSYLKGISLKNVIEGKEKETKSSIIVEYMNNNNFNEVTIRTKKYKYYVNTEGLEILYDLEKDPYELYNISNKKEYNEIKSLMRLEMIKKMQFSAYNSKEKKAPY